MKTHKWKADEMEISINYKAMRIAFLFTVIALFAYCVYEYVTSSEIPTIPFVIFCIQEVLFFGSKVFFAHKMTKEHGDEE